MKTPIINQYDRQNILYTRIEIVKLSFRRSFDKSIFGKLCFIIIDFLAKKLNKSTVG